MATGGAATTAATAGQGGAVPGNSSSTGNGPSVGDTMSDLKRFFTITLDVREEYDDNIATAPDGSNKQSSFEEIISPSILFSYPMDNSTFDARYTFGYTYYNSGRSNQNSDQDHDIVLRYNHSFSDRFNLDLRDDGGYHVDPSLLDGLGSTAREGGYYSNIFTGEFTAQWTPLFGTVTSYSNNFITYENGAVGQTQDSEENTISNDFRFALWPTVTFATGVIYDNLDYLHGDRGFSNYTGNVGLDWQALPSLSLGFRVGASVTDINQGADSISPYASANVNWQLGERSRLIGSYVHTVTPTDITYAEGQESDRFTVNFLYNVTDRITTHLEGIYSLNNIDNSFLTSTGGVAAQSFDEDVVSFDTGATYHYSQYLDFEAGYIFSMVSSPYNFDDYTRNQVYLGVRGTY